MSDDYLANLDDMDISKKLKKSFKNLHKRFIPLPEKSVSLDDSPGKTSKLTRQPDSKRKRIINFLVMTSKKTINGIPFEFIREIPIREGDIKLWGIEE